MATNHRSPLSDDVFGYMFCFRWTDALYGDAVAEVVLDALRCVRFSGRCEYYSGDRHRSRRYLAGVGLRRSKPRVATEVWWSAFIDCVAAGSAAHGGIELVRLRSRCTSVGGIRSTLCDHGAVLFQDGVPRKLLGYGRPQPDEEWVTGRDDESWWASAVSERRKMYRREVDGDSDGGTDPGE